MGKEASPTDPLLDLFLYAPIGMLYELPEVLPQAIKRGRSQVQLAKVMAQMAKNSDGSDNSLAVLETTITMASQVFSKALLDLADALTPDDDESADA